jgi:XTP/dITP diphosphohydrolase
MEKVAESFLRLVGIMDDLREKCPWDRKQTIQTLRQLSIEELYELADAITEEDWKGIREELGDLFLHLVFYAKIGSEQGRFTLDEVLNGISDKLVARHPHIYGEVVVRDEEDVKRNWEKLKLKEGKKSVLAGVPGGLPALVKAMRLQEKARQVGFEWENADQVWDKVEEETRELKEAVVEGDQDQIEEEWGDLLFSMVNYARFLKVDAENALERTNKKFIRRFTRMEALAAERGQTLADMSLSAMDDLWNQAKKEQK